MNRNVDIVLGTLFGDEGKGNQVNHLASIRKSPLIIRFNGGHQVGHTVVTEEHRHVFSNFGSGTLQGAPTYWSEFCTVSPVGVQKEGQALAKLGITPTIYYNPNAMVTTPFDVLMNYKLEELNMHGSVGVGFGQTIQRNEDHYHLYVRDLLYPEIRDEKLKLIQEKYYGYPSPLNAKAQKLVDNFIAACDELVTKYEVSGIEKHLDHNFIFEGGQGIMLDTDYGFFPNVTRSSCTSRNAITIIENLFPFKVTMNTYYMTRAYQCRHGNGHMTNEDLNTDYITPNPRETNVDEGMQGVFRKSVLDLDMLEYAVSCDTYENPRINSRHMVITCLDQVPEDIPVTAKGDLGTVKWDEIPFYCGRIENKHGVWSATGTERKHK